MLTDKRWRRLFARAVFVVAVLVGLAYVHREMARLDRKMDHLVEFVAKELAKNEAGESCELEARDD